MARTVYLAYDGSINNDWVSCYAIRMAAAADGCLRVLCVDDPAEQVPDLAVRLQRLVREGARAQVAVEPRVLPKHRDVARTLTAGVAGEDGALVVCGLRARASRRGLLGGTVSETLLRRRQLDVLAIRVVSPGMLGSPRRLLYAVSENLHSAARAAGFLSLLAPSLELISLFTVAIHSPFQPHQVTPTYRARVRAGGRAYLQRVRQALEHALEPVLEAHPLRFDENVAMGSDWPGEITRHAARIRAHMLLVGASQATLAARPWSDSPLERILRHAPCDTAVFAKAAATAHVRAKGP